jgi:Ca2+-binding RTX toxin-like protein
MAQIIPDGPGANDKITLGFGVWTGTGAHALDGNDPLLASFDQFTVAAGAGSDSIKAFEADALVKLGTGNDTIGFFGGPATMTAGSGSNGKDRIFVTQGNFSIHLGGGNDTVIADVCRSTVTASSGNDSIGVQDGPYSIRLGGGADTVHAADGPATIVTGNGPDSISARNGHFSIHVGSGSDTVLSAGADATIVAGHGHDKITAGGGQFLITAAGGHDTLDVDGGSGTVSVGHSDNRIRVGTGTFKLLASGGHDTITGGAGSADVHGHGFDSVDDFRGLDRLVFDQGHDTIRVTELSGVVTGNGGNDSIEVTDSSARVNANASHDTIDVGGFVTLKAGHNDLVRFEDQSDDFTGLNAQALREVLVKTSGGHDTFEYEYRDDNNESGAHAGDADRFRVGEAVIADFNKHTDVLRFHDTGIDGFTPADLQNAARVVDHGQHHDVDIVILTNSNAAAGTIVLKGMGTLGNKLHSINALVAHGYHLEFG